MSARRLLTLIIAVAVLAIVVILVQRGLNSTGPTTFEQGQQQGRRTPKRAGYPSVI